MALEKVKIVDRIEVLEDGCVQVRTRTSILENGTQISGTFHRHIIVPGETYSSEDTRVQAICAATHTAEVIAAYKAANAAKGV
jgi:archaellum component FlaF (FlaF/FlaG flagellin family)